MILAEVFEKSKPLVVLRQVVVCEPLFEDEALLEDAGGAADAFLVLARQVGQLLQLFQLRATHQSRNTCNTQNSTIRSI